MLIGETPNLGGPGGFAPPAAPVAPAPPAATPAAATPPSDAGVRPRMPNKLKGTMVGVAPPMMGAAPSPVVPPKASPAPAPAASGPGAPRPAAQHQPTAAFPFIPGGPPGPPGAPEHNPTTRSDPPFDPFSGQNFGSVDGAAPVSLGSPMGDAPMAGPYGTPPPIAGGIPLTPPPGSLGPSNHPSNSHMAAVVGPPPGQAGTLAFNAPPVAQHAAPAPPPDYGQVIAPDYGQPQPAPTGMVPTNYGGQQPGYGMQPMQQHGMQQHGMQQQPPPYGMQPPGAMMTGGGLGGDMVPAGDKQKITTLLLCIFLGGFGAHRFYTGYTMFGVIQLFTGGGCGIWWLYDLVTIVTSKYRDAQGRALSEGPGAG